MEDLKAKLAVQEVELWQRNTDIEALIAKIGQQTDKLNQERAVADAEEQRVGVCVVSGLLKQQYNRCPESSQLTAYFIIGDGEEGL